MKNRGIILFAALLLGFFLSSLVSAGTLKVTEEHPFLVDGKWISASELKAGDILSTSDGKKVRITSVEDVVDNEGFEVYNLEAGKYHNFVVDSGDNLEIVVHNSNAILTGESSSLENTVSYDFQVVESGTGVINEYSASRRIPGGFFGSTAISNFEQRLATYFATSEKYRKYTSDLSLRQDFFGFEKEFTDLFAQGSEFRTYLNLPDSSHGSFAGAFTWTVSRIQSKGIRIIYDSTLKKQFPEFSGLYMKNQKLIVISPPDNPNNWRAIVRALFHEAGHAETDELVKTAISSGNRYVGFFMDVSSGKWYPLMEDPVAHVQQLASLNLRAGDRILYYKTPIISKSDASSLKEFLAYSEENVLMNELERWIPGSQQSSYGSLANSALDKFSEMYGGAKYFCKGNLEKCAISQQALDTMSLLKSRVSQIDNLFPTQTPSSADLRVPILPKSSAQKPALVQNKPITEALSKASTDKKIIAIATIGAASTATVYIFKDEISSGLSSTSIGQGYQNTKKIISNPISYLIEHIF